MEERVFIEPENISLEGNSSEKREDLYV